MLYSQAELIQYLELTFVTLRNILILSILHYAWLKLGSIALCVPTVKLIALYCSVYELQVPY